MGENRVRLISGLLGRDRGWLLLIILLALALRLYKLADQSMWWDELATAGRSTLPPDKLLEELFRIRNHMPFYFLVIAFWGKLGIGAFVLRFFSLLWGVLTIPLTFQIGREVANRRVGLAAAFLLALSPLHIWYSQEARMYTMLTALVLAQSWFLLRAIHNQRRREWVGYALSGMLALATHYFAAFILIAHYVFITLWYRRDRQVLYRWLASAALTAVPFVLWFGAIMLTGGFREAPINWIQPVRWYDPLLTLQTFAAGSTLPPYHPAAIVLLLLLLLPLLLTLPPLHPRKAKGSRSPEARASLLLHWLLIPLLLTYLISIDIPLAMKRSIYMDRYLLMTLPAFLLLSVRGIARLAQRESILPVVLTLTAALIAFSLANLYFNPAYERGAWQEALSFVQEEWQNGDEMMITPGQILPVLYYGNGDLDYLLLPAKGKPEARWGTEMACLAREAGARVWLVDAVANIDPHGYPQARNENIRRGDRNQFRQWLENHYPLLLERTFPGIRLTLHDVSRHQGEVSCTQ